MIDRIRQDIQHRLDQLLAEAEKLRAALSALSERGRPTPAARARPTSPAPAAARRSPRRAAPARARSQNGAGSRTRPGETKSKVLAALAGGEAMTAGDVAKASGLTRGTVSTTLSKLTKTGEVAKADRGYKLPG